MSPHKADSELSRINRDAASRAVPVTRRDGRACSRARSEFSHAVRWRVRHHLSPASAALYDYRAGRRARRDATLARARAAGRLAATSSSTRSARTVRFARAGHAHRPRRLRQGLCGRQRAPRSCGATASRHAIVSAGGDSRVIGDRRGRPWTIGIRDPRRQRRRGRDAAARGRLDLDLGRLRALLRRATACASTTSSTRRPATSPRGVHSVTVLAEDGLTTRSAVEVRVRDGRGARPGADRIAARRRRGRRRCRRQPALLDRACWPVRSREPAMTG